MHDSAALRICDCGAGSEAQPGSVTVELDLDLELDLPGLPGLEQCQSWSPSLSEQMENPTSASTSTTVAPPPGGGRGVVETAVSELLQEVKELERQLEAPGVRFRAACVVKHWARILHGSVRRLQQDIVNASARAQVLQEKGYIWLPPGRWRPLPETIEPRQRMRGGMRQGRGAESADRRRRRVQALLNHLMKAHQTAGIGAPEAGTLTRVMEWIRPRGVGVMKAASDDQMPDDQTAHDDQTADGAHAGDRSSERLTADG